MKKSIFFTMAAAVMAFASCSKETPAEKLDSQQIFTINADIAVQEVKTQLYGTVDIHWTKGDQIDVNTTNGRQPYTLDGDGGSASGTFSGSYPLPSWDDQTFYPYGMNPSWADDKWSVTLDDALYTYSEDNVKAPMWGRVKSKTGEVESFTMLTGVVKVDITNIPEDAAKLAFITDGQKVKGTFAISDNKISTEATTKDDETKIIIPFTRSRNMTFFIPVPVGTYSNCKLQLWDAEGKALVKKKMTSLEVSAAGKIVYTPAFSCSSTDATTIWEGSEAIGNWGGSQVLAWGGYDWSTVAVGTTIRIHFTEDEAEYYQLSLRHGHDWGELAEQVFFNLSDGQTYQDYVLTEANQADLVANGGLVIRGYMITITKVELITPAAPETVIWKGSAPIDDWGGMTDLTGSSFDWSKVSVGTTIRIYFTEDEAGYHKLALRHGDGWGELPEQVSFDLSDGQTYQDYVLTEANQADLAANGGLVMTGYMITITKVALL